MFCTQCGSAMPQEARYCSSCGTAVEVGTRSTPPVESGDRRPRAVWIITIFYVLSVGFTLLSFGLVFSGSVPLNSSQEEYFANLSVVDYLLTLGSGVLTLWATTELFRLRRQAVTAFGVALVFNVGLTVVHAATTSWARALGSAGLAGVLFAWAILLAVWLYSRRLHDRGALAA